MLVGWLHLPRSGVAHSGDDTVAGLPHHSYLRNTGLCCNSSRSHNWLSTVNCPSEGTEETSTSNKIFRECCDNNERPTGKKNTTVEWDDGGKIDNKSTLILTRISLSILMKSKSGLNFQEPQTNIISLYSSSFRTGGILTALNCIG